MERADFIHAQRLYTALPTPFEERTEESPQPQKTHPDIDTYRQFVARQFDEKNSVLTSGTTGESPTTTPEEEALLRMIALEEKRNHRNTDIAVISGIGSNDTAHAVEFTEAAVRAKVDGALSVNPYYNKPNQTGLYLHHAAVAEAGKGMPLIIYNIPGRTCSNIEPETLMRLHEQYPNVVGVKECNPAQMTPEVIRNYPDTFRVWTGEDGVIVPNMQAGANGAVSVLANADPKGTREIVELCARQEYEKAQAMLDERAQFIKLLFDGVRGGNPASIKAFLKRQGFGNGEVRLPVVPATSELEDELYDEGKKLGFVG